jgi:hypothetical protein
MIAPAGLGRNTWFGGWFGGCVSGLQTLQHWRVPWIPLPLEPTKRLFDDDEVALYRIDWSTEG